MLAAPGYVRHRYGVGSLPSRTICAVLRVESGLVTPLWFQVSHSVDGAALPSRPVSKSKVKRIRTILTGSTILNVESVSKWLTISTVVGNSYTYGRNKTGYVRYASRKLPNSLDGITIISSGDPMAVVIRPKIGYCFTPSAIAKSMAWMLKWPSRVWQRTFERRELIMGKLIRSVLGGGSGGNAAPLPANDRLLDPTRLFQRIQLDLEGEKLFG